MSYSELKISFDKPNIWRRPHVEKLPEKGKSFQEVLKDVQEFDKLKEGVKNELTTVIDKNVSDATDINQINQRINEICEHYGKALIATEDINTNILLKTTNQNTLNKKLQGWCNNLVHNIPDVIDTKPYNDLIGKFKDVPAFVCAAGPSLANNAELLSQVKDKALVIAVDTSLRPLLNMGVVPDICVTHDANPNGCKFFLSETHDLNRHNVNLNSQSDNELGFTYALLQNDKDRLNYKYDTLGLFVNYCHPLTLLAWNGRERRFYGVLDPSLPVYDVMASCCNYKMEDGKLVPENKGRVVGGSSVGHVAMYIAVALGCNPISLLGLDLSYPNLKTYVKGASNQKDVSKQKLIEVNSLSGGRVKTNASMLSYKLVFEQAFPHIVSQLPHLRFYNCTEDETGKPAGVLEVGGEPQPLQWVIDNYCQEIQQKVVKLKNGTENK